MSSSRVLITRQSPRRSARPTRSSMPVVLLGLVTVTLAVIVAHVSYGEYPIAPLDVLRTVVGLPTANDDYGFIVNTLRLPRVLVAWLVGAAFALSGAILQTLTRNPLADPGIMGVSNGASLAVVSLIVLVPKISSWYLPLAAFAGASLIVLLIYILAWSGGHTPLRLILVGIGLGAITSAATTIMITFGEITQVTRALIWLVGSVYGRGWTEFWILFPLLAAIVPFGLLSARQLNALNLGNDVARGLGVAVDRRRTLLLLAAVALAAGAVATAGTIGFVGLIAPHMARRLVNPLHEYVLPVTMLLGGLIVPLADLVGRVLFTPIEIPCGVITAVIGAPFFLYLLYRRAAQERTR